MGKKVGRVDLAAEFGVTETTISNWQRDGMPVHARKRGPRGNLYDLEDCKAWRNGRGRKGAAVPAELREAEFNHQAERARIAHYQANIAQLDAEERRGKLWPVETVSLLFAHIIGAARGRLLAIDGKLRNRVPDMDPRVYELVETLIREALDELSSESFPDAVRASLEKYHEFLASAAENDAQPVDEDSRRDH